MTMPTWGVATNSEGLLDMIYLLLKSFSVGGQDFGAVDESSNNTLFVFQRLVTGKAEILVCVCTFSVHAERERSISVASDECV